MSIAGQAGSTAGASDSLRDLQKFYGMFPFVVVPAIVAQSIAGLAEKPLQAHVATGPDLGRSSQAGFA